MNYGTARKLLIDQAMTTEENPDALLMRMQQGKPPIPGHVTSILLALKVIFEELKDATIIDKELANSLYQLSIKSQQFFAVGRKTGIEWPPLLKEDLLRIAIAVESIFSGDWQTLH
jgi:hypothetical protein